MGLQNVISKATRGAFNAMGDIPQALTIRRTTPGVFDPALGMEVGGGTVDYPCRGVILSYSQNLIDGTVIQAGDKQASIEAASLAVEPMPGDTLIQGAESWSVLAVNPVKPGSVAFLYKLQVRR